MTLEQRLAVLETRVAELEKQAAAATTADLKQEMLVTMSSICKWIQDDCKSDYPSISDGRALHGVIAAAALFAKTINGLNDYMPRTLGPDEGLVSFQLL